MKYFTLIVLLAFTRVITADLTKAYGLYLTGDYDSAYSYYKTEFEINSDNLDAVYGMVNCDIARQKFNSALNMVNSTIAEHQNSILFSKLIYIYGRKNNTKKALQIFENAKQQFSDVSLIDSLSYSTGSELSDILYSAGCGFYDAGNFRTALQWFSKGDSLFNGVPLYKQAITNSNAALKNKVILSANVNGGILAYSSNPVYKNGNFFTGNFSLLLNQRDKIKIAFSRTDIRFNPIIYGINYDTLYASRDGNPELSGYNVLSSRSVSTGGRRDTMYFVNTETVLSKSNNSFDTIINFLPQNYYQNDFYLSFTDYGKILKNTDISAGCRLSFTNMLNANRLNTFIVNHNTRISSIGLGCSYYASFLDHDQIYQVSPHVEFTKNHFFSNLTFNAVSPPVGKTKNALYDSFQLSSDLLAGLKLKTLTLSLRGSLGNKKFLNAAEGEFINNVLYKYRYGFESLIQWTPLNKGVTLYQLFDYSNFTINQNTGNESNNFSKFAIMGGIYIQW